MDIFRIAGIIGLILISAGIILKKRKYQDILYLSGGILLLIYSIHQRDAVFIILESIFSLASLYDYLKH